MRVGITLPHFAEDATPSLEAAARAEALGLDGAFCFDHLWPMGRPDRPALASWPLLAAVMAATDSLTVGTLVARVGLLPDDLLVAACSTLAELGGGRFVAGLGTGDHLSEPENLAYGVPYEHAAARRRRLGEVAGRLVARGIPVWVGGGAPPTVAVARAHDVPVNVWGAGPARVAAMVADGLEVTWGGPLPGAVAEVADRLAELAAAGATWAVAAAPRSLEALAEAATRLRGP